MKKLPKNKQKSIVKQYHEGMHVKDICKRYDIPKSTLYTWIYKYPPLKLRNKFLAPTGEHKSIQRYTTKLENELTILRSFLEFKGVTRKDKYAFMDLIYGEYTIHELCGAFAIDRSTYYNHLRSRDVNTYFRDRDAKYDSLILGIHKDFPFYGAGRIRTAIVSQTGDNVSEKYIRSRMAFLGIESIRSSKKRPRFLQWNTRKQTLLVKQLDITGINQVWYADITECYIRGKKLYISFYEDMYSRKIVAYNVGYNQSTNLVRLGLEKAVKTRKPNKGLILHTDGGAQYNSWTMRRLYAKYKISHSTSKPSTPTDNPYIESFNSSVKAEFIMGGTQFHSEFEFRELLDEYIEKYNDRRIHTVIGTSPTTFETNTCKKSKNNREEHKK